MRIIFASMPMIALVAIFAANANQRLEFQAQHSFDKITAEEAAVLMRPNKSGSMARFAKLRMYESAHADDAMMGDGNGPKF